MINMYQINLYQKFFFCNIFFIVYLTLNFHANYLRITRIFISQVTFRNHGLSIEDTIIHRLNKSKVSLTIYLASSKDNYL